MMRNYLVFDFGESFFRDRLVIDLVIEKMPVSISLGVWTTVLVYLISIPLGIAKAVGDGNRFDVWTSFALVIGTAIPSFLFAVFLLVVFAGGSYLDWFPLRGLTSDDWEALPPLGRVLDYFWHITLPVFAMVNRGIRNPRPAHQELVSRSAPAAICDHRPRQGVDPATGAIPSRVRNAMLIVIAGFPAAFIGILFTGSVLIEIIFSLDGLGLLGFEAAFNRDYPLMFGTLYFFSLLGLLMNLIGDLMYTVIDPRIDFESRES